MSPSFNVTRVAFTSAHSAIRQTDSGTSRLQAFHGVAQTKAGSIPFSVFVVDVQTAKGRQRAIILSFGQLQRPQAQAAGGARSAPTAGAPGPMGQPPLAPRPRGSDSEFADFWQRSARSPAPPPRQTASQIPRPRTSYEPRKPETTSTRGSARPDPGLASERAGYLSTLGFSAGAKPTSQEINKRFREKARDLHPDKAFGLPPEVQQAREEEFKKVGNARDCLLQEPQ